MMDGIIGLVLATTIAGIAYYRESLSGSGALAAIVIGTLIYASGGVFMMAVLLTFFVSSNLIGRLFAIKKAAAKRTLTQVMANGLVAAVVAAIYSATQEEQYLVLFVISIAVATADTWSSELGVLSKSSPVSVLTLKPVEYGVSGAVTNVGLVASLVGAVLISSFLRFNAGVILFGFVGSLLDSFLGHFQVRYINEQTGQIHEDQDRQSTDQYYSGVRLLTNDSVNFLSNALTVFAAYLIL